MNTHSKRADCADWKKHVSTMWRNSRRAFSFIKQNTTEPNVSRRILISHNAMSHNTIMIHACWRIENSCRKI